MTTWAVFCTAELPSEALSTFEELSASGKTLQNTFSSWLFIKGPSNLNTVTGTPVSTFDTGFLDATPTRLQAFLLSLFTNTETKKAKSPYQEVDFELSSHCFVVLDKRSIKDSTCQVYYRYQYMPTLEGYEGDPPDWDEETGITEWKTWRLEYRIAWYFLTSLWHMPKEVILDLETGASVLAYVDEKGLLQQTHMEREFDHIGDRVPSRRELAES